MHLATRIAALMGFLGVAIGAFGAHILNPTLLANGTLGVWETAVLYQLVHAVASLWAAGKNPVIVWIWTAGIVLFSGSLYLYAVTNISKFGMITPIGGLFFLAGWVYVIAKPK